MNNAEIADSFSLLSKLMDIHGANSFKAKSYANTAFQIDRLDTELSALSRDAIAQQKGIGESAGRKIIELLDTGRMTDLDELLKKTPAGILELMKIKGIGPKKIAVIWNELGIESPGELLYACEENRLIHYKGFGEKSQQSIAEAIQFYLSNQGSFLYAQVEPLAHQFMHELPILLQTEVALSGDMLRQNEVLDTLEWVVALSPEEVLDKMKNLPVWEPLQSDDSSVIFRYAHQLNVCFYCCDAASFEATCFKHSCNETFWNEWQRLYPETPLNRKEEEVFESLSLPYIPSALRDQPEVLEIARQGQLPSLIRYEDIRGIIHNHSTWSDGSNSIEEMAQACIRHGFEYLVMSDHSVSSFYANGLNADRIKQQQEEIDALNEKLKPFRIFKSIECDILNDGSLDYPDSVLKTFDLVICSVHQNLKMSEDKAMERILRAIENPYTRILGHCSGRLLLSRKAYPLRYPELIAACRQHNVVIEINANPRRLDIDWRWLHECRKQNVLCSVNPDAHHTDGILDIRYGVLAAQKGLLTAGMNLSSYSLTEFETILKNKVH